MKIGIIGTGTIASAVVHALAGQGHAITLSERNAHKARQLADIYPGDVTIAPNAGVVAAAEVIFLGTTAEAAPAALAGLAFRPDQRVISLMAGIAPETVAALIAPAVLDSQMIPFPAIAQGGSPVLVQPDSALVTALFGASNTVIALPDADHLRPFMAAQAVLSPVLRMVEDSRAWLVDRTATPEEADRFLRLLVGGALLARPPGTAAALPAMLAELDTEGGLNAQLRDHMLAQGQATALRDGLDALERRLRETR